MKLQIPLLVTSAAGVNGSGYGALLAFDADGRPLGPFSRDSRIADPRGLGIDQIYSSELSPLDLAIAPNRNIIVSSERPFGAANALTGVRQCEPTDGHLVRVFSAGTSAEFRKPRGLPLGPDGFIYCGARDEVVAFDFASGRCLGSTVRFPRLYGQALIFFP
jgi:hypothetical protein